MSDKRNKGEFLVYEALNMGKHTHRLPWRRSPWAVRKDLPAIKPVHVLFSCAPAMSGYKERSAAMPGSLEEEVQLRRWDVETTAVLAHLPSAFSYRGKPQARDSTTVQPKSSSATASLLLCLACLLLEMKTGPGSVVTMTLLCKRTKRVAYSLRGQTKQQCNGWRCILDALTQGAHNKHRPHQRLTLLQGNRRAYYDSSLNASVTKEEKKMAQREKAWLSKAQTRSLEEQKGEGSLSGDRRHKKERRRLVVSHTPTSWRTKEDFLILANQNLQIFESLSTDQVDSQDEKPRYGNIGEQRTETHPARSKQQQGLSCYQARASPVSCIPESLRQPAPELPEENRNISAQGTPKQGTALRGSKTTIYNRQANLERLTSLQRVTICHLTQTNKQLYSGSQTRSGNVKSPGCLLGQCSLAAALIWSAQSRDPDKHLGLSHATVIRVKRVEEITGTFQRQGLLRLTGTLNLEEGH
ncbi:hypothetical protein ACRRTK_019996 [Alexandromys fortis]